ncbi:MAG: SHOCT domain-containing protein [Anaerolineae bacterium]|nr:SHOCT domain-containing protein [Anaerolineae bacterium]
MLAFWSALIIGTVLLTRWLGGMVTPSGGAGRELAILVLRRRYAAGGITQEEYERMRQELER